MSTTMAPPTAIMKEAGRVLSRILLENNIEHAFIGGFALKLLGHDRETMDVDVEVGVDNAEDLRGRVTKILCDADNRFVVSNLKLFFVPGDDGNSRVPVEALARGTLNLPRRLRTISPGDGKFEIHSLNGCGLTIVKLGSVPVLQPGVLVLTKIKRCAQYIGSTRPQSIAKFTADAGDIHYLLHWLNDNDEKVDFAGYDAGVPDRLYEATRAMRNHWMSTGQVDIAQLLDSVLTETDRVTVVS